MKANKKSTHTNEWDSWRLAILLIRSFLCIVLLGLGYILLEDHIIIYFDQKEYNPEELNRLNNRIRPNSKEANYDKIINGSHQRTGLKADPNLQVIIHSCTSCHSAKLITQNRATREGWKSMIDWMQETQGLPNLGVQEPIILDYLAKHYAPANTGRRKNLDMAAIEWYILEIK